ncbi:MAG: hypothetical protein ABIH04_10315 [Planctomycetota bacterium]
MTHTVKDSTRVRVHCRICGRDLAPEEIAREVGDDAFCDTCIEGNEFLRILSEQHAREAAKLVEKIKPEKKRKYSPRLLVIGAAIIVAEVILLILYPPHFPLNRHLAHKGPRVEFTNKLDYCLENVWVLRGALEKYRVEHNAFPESLDELVPEYLTEKATCPHTGRPYRYERKGDNYLLECPNPQKHGIESLTCDGKSGAPLIIVEKEE